VSTVGIGGAWGCDLWFGRWPKAAGDGETPMDEEEDGRRDALDGLRGGAAA
jgi:hypothetical protein